MDVVPERAALVATNQRIEGDGFFGAAPQDPSLSKGRVEAFSDGVIAIIITIMVLELHPPEGHDPGEPSAGTAKILGYVPSFVYVGIYWNNHHHLMQAVRHVPLGIGFLQHRQY